MSEMVWQGTWPSEERATRRLDEHVLALVFVAIAGSGSWFLLANTTGLLQEFGGNLRFLGAAAHYAAVVPSLVAWLLVLVAALLLQPVADAPDAQYSLRIGLRALAVGAVFEVLATVASLWQNVLTSHQYAYAPSTIASIADLVRASSAFGFAALVVFALGALRASATHRVTDPRLGHATSPWRAALIVLGVALGIGAIAPGYDLFASLPRSAPPFQLSIFMNELPAALLWFGAAVALCLVHRALTQARRTLPLTLGVSIGVLGATLLGIASASQLAYYEVWNSSPSSVWAAAFGKLSSASTVAGWLMVTIAFGIAALALDRRRTRSSAERTRSTPSSAPATR